MRYSRQNSLIVIIVILVVVDNFKRIAILMFMSSSFFIKITYLMLSWNLSLMSIISVKMLQRPVYISDGWMDGVDKEQWLRRVKRKTTLCMWMIYEKKSMIFLFIVFTHMEKRGKWYFLEVLKESMKINYIEFRLGKMKNTVKINRSTLVVKRTTWRLYDYYHAK